MVSADGKWGRLRTTRAKKRGLNQRAEIGRLPGRSDPHTQKNPEISTKRLGFGMAQCPVSAT